MTTSIFYPDSGEPGVTTCDGSMERASVDEPFATIRAGEGTALNFDTGRLFVQLWASTTTNQYKSLFRAIMLFDTSSIPEEDEVSEAKVNLTYSVGAEDLGDDTTDIVSSNPLSNVSVNDYDFDTLGDVNFGTGTTSLASMVAETEYEWPLNPDGIDAINKGGITKLGLRLSDDRAGTLGMVWVSNAYTYAGFYSANAGGTTTDPKLTVEHGPAQSFVPSPLLIVG